MRLAREPSLQLHLHSALAFRLRVSASPCLGGCGGRVPRRGRWARITASGRGREYKRKGPEDRGLLWISLKETTRAKDSGEATHADPGRRAGGGRTKTGTSETARGSRSPPEALVQNAVLLHDWSCSCSIRDVRDLALDAELEGAPDRQVASMADPSRTDLGSRSEPCCHRETTRSATGRARSPLGRRSEGPIGRS